MLQNLLLNIDAGTIDWSRAQFALTAIYHWLFVPLTLGLAVIMGIVETKYYQTKDEFWKEAAKFWQKLFGINFAMGVATGIILEFEFGTNWSNYSWFVGDIFGAPLAVEGIVAFFMESTFVAVMYFGWKKVSPGFHLASTWLTGLGATISAWWIDTMRNEMVSFAEVALSPFAISKFCHTVTSSWIIGGIFCVGVCCWYLMKKRHTRLAVESMKIGAGVGLVAALLAGATGHKSGMDVTNDPKGYVPGINDLLNGYTTPDGKTEPSADEKIARGKKAIEALAAYRKAKAEGAPDSTINYQLSIINSNMKYFGYGYVKDKADLVPPVLVNFWAFRVMVGVGCLFILFFAVILAVTYKFPKALFKKYDITTLPAWHYWVAILLIPLAYIGSECGWLVAEFGRQPWTIQDMLPTWASVSDLQSSSVIITFFLFLVLFTTMLAVEINILLKQIKKGPEL